MHLASRRRRHAYAPSSSPTGAVSRSPSPAVYRLRDAVPAARRRSATLPPAITASGRPTRPPCWPLPRRRLILFNALPDRATRSSGCNRSLPRTASRRRERCLVRSAGGRSNKKPARRRGGAHRDAEPSAPSVAAPASREALACGIHVTYSPVATWTATPPNSYHRRARLRSDPAEADASRRRSSPAPRLRAVRDRQASPPRRHRRRPRTPLPPSTTTARRWRRPTSVLSAPRRLRADLVMTAHAVYPALRHASAAVAAILRTLLRCEGFGLRRRDRSLRWPLEGTA